MKLSATCMACMVKRQEENLRGRADEEKNSEYMRKVLNIIAEAPEEISAPVVTQNLNDLHEEFFGTPFSFGELKKRYNALMLALEPEISREIESGADPLLAALKYARTGNYIDFGAMGTVDDNKLRSLLEKARNEDVDLDEYGAFLRNLSTAKRLTYCTDNCGEIVLDKLFLRQLQARFPGLSITVLVRGGEVLNDATLEDAEAVGLTKACRVLGNGNRVAGTDLASLSLEAKEAVQQADVLISKGQGNFETLHGCGLNIYYLFLCKCDWFTRRFGLDQFKGVFVNEQNHKIK